MYPKDNPNHRRIQSRTIRALIRKRFGSISAFCRSTGTKRVYVYAVIRGAKRSEEYARIISEALGKTPRDLWPTIYPATETAA